MTENFDGTEKPFLFASLDPKLKATGLRLAYSFIGWGGRIRTSECGDQNPVPYRLATPQLKRLRTRGSKPLCEKDPCLAFYFRFEGFKRLFSLGTGIKNAENGRTAPGHERATGPKAHEHLFIP